MIKERISLIRKYIEGDYIENLSSLQDDYLFMIDAIIYSNDRNLYYLCSKNVRTNLEFVKFMIDKFKNRKSFVCHVVDVYLNNVDENDKGRFEILIMFSDILSTDCLDSTTLKYNMLKHSIYKENICEIRDLIENNKIDLVESNLGFSHIISKYGDNKVITNYFAYNFLSEIFYCSYQLRLEDLLHNIFTDRDKLVKYGIVDFIYDYVKGYDKILAEYLIYNLDVVRDVEKSIDRIISNWDSYSSSLVVNDSVSKFLLDVVIVNCDRILGLDGLKKVRKKEENTN